MNIGENIKKYRKEKGMTQQQLADAINKSKSTIEKYEANKIKNFSFEILNQISEVLGVPINTLCGLNINPIIDKENNSVLNYKDKITQETIYNEDLNDYLQFRMAEQILDKEIFKSINAVRTLLFYSSLELNYIIDDMKDVKIKISTRDNTYSKEFNIENFFDFIKKITFNIESEIKYMKYLEDKKVK